MADTAPAAPVFKKRANKANIRKRPATPPPADDSESEYTSSEENGVRIKRRRTEGVTTTQSTARAADLRKSTAYAADRTTNITANDDATKASTWFTDSALAAGDAPVKQVEAKEDGVYGGTAQYGSFIQKNPDARKLGPQKAPTNVRTITVTDFAPDVCKDYKQTGFCGFGDSCKFLHAREDYKQGWQLDKEWEKVGSKKDKKDGGNGKEDEGLDEEEKMLRDIPFKCVICKEDYKTPVVTKCGHYFCEKCAMGRYMKGKKKTCAACGADTGGSFGVARKLKALLEKKRKREEEREAEGEDEKS